MVFLAGGLALVLVTLGFLLGSSSDITAHFTSDRLTALLHSGVATKVYYLVFFVSCVLGSILGMLIVQPASVHTALATGLGWPFIVRFLVKGMKTTGRPPENPTAR